jgi:hypothetical protein
MESVLFREKNGDVATGAASSSSVPLAPVIDYWALANDSPTEEVVRFIFDKYSSVSDDTWSLQDCRYPFD